jgi:hypothetical protein
MGEIGEFEIKKHVSEILKAVDGGVALTIKKGASLSSAYCQTIVCNKQY